jgi:hypothetical protein
MNLLDRFRFICTHMIKLAPKEVWAFLILAQLFIKKRYDKNTVSFFYEKTIQNSTLQVIQCL